ncbi:efflux transporter outer membrane subunit [uncultured Draconibacterium sp.]|uniref:efflux transporter outer membrane subunit n=1 Tax=uncultured Draconibacterium sp. TaxID=1573823 RepID=UPI002AA5E4CC|nr:efflux transporter outer membrane subunit [uncultured Draconibacterium sp.]
MMRKAPYNNGIFITVCVILFFVVSCKIGEKYTRPELNLPEQLVEDRIDSLSFADINWWELYTDSVLQGIIQTALENNKDILIATSRLKQYWAAKQIATVQLFPQADAVVHGEREMQHYDGEEREVSPEYALIANVGWELDLWGNIRWGREASMADYLATVEAKRAVELSLIAEVAELYFNLIALDDELSIVKKTIDSRKEGLRIANLRFKGGLTSETSVQQAQVELANTVPLKPDLERSIRAIENQLALLMGAYNNKIERGIGLADQNPPENLPIGLSSFLLNRRPDIREAEQQLIAANAMVGVAVTNRFPRISLTAEIGTENDDLESLLSSPFWFVAGDILTPIFAAGKLKNQQKRAEAIYEEEIYAYQKTVLNAFHETNAAIITIEKAKEITIAHRNRVRAASEYKRLAEIQYLNGAIGYLDLLDSQRSLLDAEISLNNAKRDELIALVQLYKSLGGGWQAK